MQLLRIVTGTNNMWFPLKRNLKAVLLVIVFIAVHDQLSLCRCDCIHVGTAPSRRIDFTFVSVNFY
jgi:hypothetical protein